MARPLRIEYPGAGYHMMNRGLARLPVFLDPPDKRLIRGLLYQGQIAAPYGQTTHLPFVSFLTRPNRSYNRFSRLIPQASTKIWLSCYEDGFCPCQQLMSQA